MNGLIGRSRSSAGRETRLSASRWSASTAARSPAPSAPGSLPWFRAEGRDAGEVQAGGIPRACEHAEGPMRRVVQAGEQAGEQVHATLNIAVWQGEGLRSLDPLGFRASVVRRGGSAPNLVPARRSPRRSAKRRSAIAANPSPAILARLGQTVGVRGRSPSSASLWPQGYAGPTLAWLSQPAVPPRTFSG